MDRQLGFHARILPSQAHSHKAVKPRESRKNGSDQAWKAERLPRWRPRRSAMRLASEPMAKPKPPMSAPHAKCFQSLEYWERRIVAGTLLMPWERSAPVR